MDAEKLGKEIANGIMNRYAYCCILAIIIVAFVNFFAPKDDTDPIDGRSGLSIYTDNLTGVQYVGNSNGLTVRVARNGLPIFIETKSTK